MNLDELTTALADATGLPATREPSDVLTRCIHVGAPTFVRATLSANTVEVPVWLIAEGVGGRNEIEWMLEHLPTLMDALGTVQASPEPFNETPAYRLTATLTIPRS